MPGKKSLETLSIASGSIYPEFAQGVADTIGVEMAPLYLKRHPNTEQYGRFTKSVRKNDLFVLQAHSATDERSVDDAIAEQRMLISAARLASARRITAVFPYMAYSRQDRKSKSGEPITAADLVNDIVYSGAKRLLTADLHVNQIQGFTRRPFDHITAAPSQNSWFIDWIDERGTDKVVIVAPDVGRAKAVAKASEKLGKILTERRSDGKEVEIPFAIIDKRRNVTTNNAEAKTVVGNVRGKHCMLYDDMIDGAGTLRAAAELLDLHDARTVGAIATHGILSREARKNIKDSPLERVVVTNTLPQDLNLELIPNLEVIDVIPLFAKAIERIHKNKSLSKLFDGENHS